MQLYSSDCIPNFLFIFGMPCITQPNSLSWSQKFRSAILILSSTKIEI
uniref:Uncharacterized protein n=1 Tax=Arundo donax TaxID=35708 RepID=A0A0A8XY16_ARUDO